MEIVPVTQPRRVVTMARVWPRLAVTILVGAVAPVAKGNAVPFGNAVRVDTGEHRVVVKGENGAIRVEFIAGGVVRLTASRDRDFPADSTHPDEGGPYHLVTYDRTTLRPTVRSTGSGWSITTGGPETTRVEIEAAPFALRVIRGAGTETALLAMRGPEALTFREGRTEGRIVLPEREHFIGGGADRHPLDLRGHSITFRTSELGQEGEGGGFPVPWVMSSRGYGLFLNNVDPTTRFDVGESAPDTLLIDAGDGGREGWNFDLYVIGGNSYAELLRGYLALTGRPILAEKWFFGNMQSKCCDWRAKDVVDIADRFRELQLPLDAMILDLQWREIRKGLWAWTPEFDESDEQIGRNNLRWTRPFGDSATMFRRLDELGVKVGLHENTRSTYSDDAAGPGPYLDQSFPDLTDPAVTARLWEMHRPLIKQGADFWWQDQGERINGRGQNGYPITNLNGSLWAKLVVEGMQREFQQSVPVISRSGPVGGHRYIAPWPGDVPAGLAFARFDLDYIRNGGLAGYATIGADMGGFYHGHTPDEENEIRRICDMFLVFPVIRTHGNYAKLPWMLAPESQLTYARYLRLRYRLLPYIYSAAVEAHESGRPILAPLCFDHGDDEETFRRDFDFMFGPDLLVAPVLEDAESREVYLPRGRWRNFWTDEIHDGGRLVQLAAPRRGGRSLPLLVREGAILPMGPAVLAIEPRLFDRFTFQVYPAPGQTSRRETKDRARANDATQIITAECADGPAGLRFTVEGAPSVETIYFHGVTRPAEVRINGAVVAEKPADATGEGWSFGGSDFFVHEGVPVLKIHLAGRGDPQGRRLECSIKK